jgi:hypothetical protein
MRRRSPLDRPSPFSSASRQQPNYVMPRVHYRDIGTYSSAYIAMKMSFSKNNAKNSFEAMIELA